MSLCTPAPPRLAGGRAHGLSGVDPRAACSRHATPPGARPCRPAARPIPSLSGTGYRVTAANAPPLAVPRRSGGTATERCPVPCLFTFWVTVSLRLLVCTLYASMRITAPRLAYLVPGCVRTASAQTQQPRITNGQTTTKCNRQQHMRKVVGTLRSWIDTSLFDTEKVTDSFFEISNFKIPYLSPVLN